MLQKSNFDGDIIVLNRILLKNLRIFYSILNLLTKDLTVLTCILFKMYKVLLLVEEIL